MMMTSWQTAWMAAAQANAPLAALMIAGIVVALVLLAVFFASRYRKVGPNQVLIVSGFSHRYRLPDGTVGRRGFRIIRGGGTFVWPVFEKVDILSLEVMTLDVQTPEVYTSQGVPVIVDGVAQIKVKGDDVSIQTASEQFLSKGKEEIAHIAHQTIEGHLRAVLGTLPVEQIYREREDFAQKVQEIAAADMANMGLQIVSFTLKNITDNQGYLNALGAPRTAQVKRDAIIGQAEADRDATIRSAEANQQGQIARYSAETRIAEADRDYRMKVQEYQASVNQKKAEADLSYDIQKYKTGQEVKREEIQIEVVAKEKSIEVQDREIKRKELELDATLRKPAEAEQFKVKTLAEAERFKLETEANGKASAQKSIGFAEADVAARKGEADGSAIKARGLASADVIRAEGLAEAEANRKKAEAWQYYNEAAIAQLLIENLPALAREVAAPLARTEKITIVSTGGNGGQGAGAHKVTQDVSQIIATLPPIIESLTGLKIDELLKRIPEMKKDNWATPPGAASLPASAAARPQPPAQPPKA